MKGEMTLPIQGEVFHFTDLHKVGRQRISARQQIAEKGRTAAGGELKFMCLYLQRATDSSETLQ